MYIFVYIYIHIIIIPPKDIKTFQLFIGEATLTVGYTQSLSFALKRAVNKVLDCIVKKQMMEIAFFIIIIVSLQPKTRR